MQRNIVLKYRQIPTRNAGEEAFKEKSWRHHHDVIGSRDVIGVMPNR